MRQRLQIVIALMAILTLLSFTSYTSMGDTTVYICVTGKVYHSNKDCRGLKNSTHEIKEISLSEAQKTRRPCKICY